MVAKLVKPEGTFNDEIDQKKTKIPEKSPSRIKAGLLADGPAQDQHTAFTAELEKRMRGIDSFLNGNINEQRQNLDNSPTLKKGKNNNLMYY